MFAGKRKELQETIANWKKSPELTRSSSARSIGSKVNLGLNFIRISILF